MPNLNDREIEVKFDTTHDERVNITLILGDAQISVSYTEEASDDMEILSAVFPQAIEQALESLEASLGTEISEA